MRTKNAKAINTQEHDHIGRVKALPCSVCDAPPPSDAHHINQGQHYTTVALCKDCHQGSFAGWHGQKRAWIARKLVGRILAGRIFPGALRVWEKRK